MILGWAAWNAVLIGSFASALRAHPRFLLGESQRDYSSRHRATAQDCYLKVLCAVAIRAEA